MGLGLGGSAQLRLEQSRPRLFESEDKHTHNRRELRFPSSGKSLKGNLKSLEQGAVVLCIAVAQDVDPLHVPLLPRFLLQSIIDCQYLMLDI